MQHFEEGKEYRVGETLVRINDIHLRFGNKVVLRGVTGEVKNLTRPGVLQGQVIGILGPSGIGKSQLTCILAGLNEPTSGQILIGENGGVPVKAGMVGVVPQNYPLLMHRRVFDQLALASTLAGKSMTVAKKEVNDLLTEFGVEDHANSWPAELSGGQRQRIAIIRQLVSSGHYIVLDEPSTGLDPISKDAVRDLIIKLSQTVDESMTIFIVSHDIRFVAAIADHLWLLGRDRDANGKIVPGAYIKHVYDLIELGFTWQPGIERDPEFRNLCDQVKDRFKEL